MQNFPQRHRRKRFLFPLAAGLLAIVIASVFMLEAFSGVRAGVHQLARPLWEAGSVGGQSFWNVIAQLRTRQALINENEALRTQLATQQLSLLEQELVEAENKRLRELWEKRTFDKTVLGQVLARPPLSPYDTLVLDVGESDGVMQGNIVLVDGVPIGSVVRVYARTALVELFSTSGRQIEIVLGASSTPLTAVGQGGGFFLAEISREILVAAGDPVALAGFTPHIFGVVETVDAESADPFVTARFQNPVNMNDVVWVEVVTDGAQLRTSLEEKL